MKIYPAVLAITTAVLSGPFTVDSAEATMRGASGAASSAASGAASSAGAAARGASNAAGAAASSAIESARGGKKVITPQEASERQRKWVEKTFEGISSGKIKVKNRDKYTDEQIIEKLNKMAEKKIKEKYDVREPDVALPTDKVKIVTLEEAEAMKARADQKLREDFAKRQDEYWKQLKAKELENEKAWEPYHKAQQARKKEQEEKERQAELKRQEDPNYIDKKGFNKTTDPNPYVEANEHKTSRGQAMKDVGLDNVPKTSRGDAFRDATR